MKEKREKFLVRGLNGKKRLSGTVSVYGAKNAALPLMAASLLCQNTLKLNNIPDIEDIRRMGEIIEDLGAVVERTGHHSYEIGTANVKKTSIDPELSKLLRASVILTGPLLARFGLLSFSHPGGCIIGARPIDIFLRGFEKMGAEINSKNGEYTLKSRRGKLQGTELFFPLQTVTVTETFMMAGVLAKGKTVLKNAALEPEIVDLANLLIKAGANIIGAGTPTITIEGGGLLSAPPRPHETIPDRIEAGSFLILGALAADELEITNCQPDHLESLLEILSESGVKVGVRQKSLNIKNNGHLKNLPWRGLNVKTHEYPGFPTDLQAPMTVFLTQVAGESLVFETIFEGRLNYTSDLVRMGADIKMWDQHRVMIKGPTPLSGRELEGPDIRAGLAYLIAAIVAKGESIINNVYYIDRGYEAIEKRLLPLGVSIERVR